MAGAGQEDLGLVLDFDAADLEANRAGILSSHQRRHIWSQDWWRVLLGAGALLAGSFICVGLLIGWIANQGRIIGVGLGLLVGGLIVSVGSVLLWLDFAFGRVKSVEGQLGTMDESGGKYPNVYSFLINGVKMRVPKAAYDQVISGSRKAYYLPHTKILVSIEPLERGASQTPGPGD
jgi:hypothetical protein